MKFEILKNGEVIDRQEFGDGSFKIGRSSSCDICLRSGQVSKEHALLIVQGKKVAIVDTGSSNGIFLNGVMIRKDRLRKGDDLKVGEFTVRIQKGAARKAEAQTEDEDHSNFPAMTGGGGLGNLAENIAFDTSPEDDPDVKPTPQEQVLNLMDEKILNPLYQLMERVDWRVILSTIIIGGMVLTVLLSVIPILRWGKSVATNEALSRAHTVVAQIVRENYRIISKANDYTRLTVEAAEEEDGILEAYVIDPKGNTIFAPQKYFNKSISDVYQLIAIKQIADNRLTLTSVEHSNGDYIVAQPITLFSPERNDREVVAVALARFRVPEGVYATYEPIIEASLFAILIALIAYFLIYKMVTHPIIRMEENLDRALKGDNVDFRCESKFPELETLASGVSSVLTRYLQYEQDDSRTIEADDVGIEDDYYLATAKEFDEGTNDAILVLNTDKEIQFVGSYAEELLDIKADIVRGKNVSEAFSQSGFSGAVIEMCERLATNFGQTQYGQTDINGVQRKVNVVAHKNSRGETKFLMVMVKISE